MRATAFWTTFGTLLAAIGCFSLDLADGVVRCHSDSRPCPDNYYCAANGYCYRDGHQAPGTTADAGMSDDAGIADDMAMVGANVDMTPEAAGARLVSPPSTSIATTRRPTLKWVLAPGAQQPQVDICSSRGCSTTIAAATVDASGTSATPDADLPRGVTYWRVRTTSAGGRVTSPTWEFTVPDKSAAAASSSGTVLDLNGDGFADIAPAAVGAPNGTGSGRVYVWYGAKKLANNNAPSATLYDAMGTATDRFGSAAISAGDVNGDGVGDLVIGAPGASPNSQTGSGRAYVYLGNAVGVSTSPAVVINGPDTSGYLGTAAAAGDFNSDGFGDIALGSPGSANGAGRVFIYFGGANGLAASAGSQIDPSAGNAAFGVAVTAGDFDGDGFADLAVAAQTAGGKIYFYRGGMNGPANAPIGEIDNPDGANSRFASVVAFAGDTNGDGYADIVVGAPGVNTSTGRMHVYYGSSAGITATGAVSLDGPDGTQTGFGTAVAGGDVNGDGYSDVAVSSFDKTYGGTVRIYAGGAAGVSTAAAVYTFNDTSGQSTDQWGYSIACRDFDDDGMSDVIVGEPGVNSKAGGVEIDLSSEFGLGVPFPGVGCPDGANSAMGTTVN